MYEPLNVTTITQFAQNVYGHLCAYFQATLLFCGQFFFLLSVWRSLEKKSVA